MKPSGLLKAFCLWSEQQVVLIDVDMDEKNPAR